MALEHDLSGLKNKTENEGTSNAGRLTAKEWNYLVEAVEEVQTKSEGAIKGIKYNGAQIFNTIDKDGYLEMTVADSSGYEVRIHETDWPTIISSGSECPINISVTNKVSSADGSLIPNKVSATVDIYVGTNLVNSGTVYDLDYSNPDSENYDPDKNTVYTYDLSNARLEVGFDNINVIKVVVNNRSGVIAETQFELRVIELGLNIPSFEGVKVFTESQKPILKAAVTGTDAQLNAFVDDKQIVFGDLLKAGDNVKTFDANIFNDVNTHGVHTLKAWAEVKRTISGKEYTISTKKLSYTYIYGTSEETPIVISNINNKTPEEYSTLKVDYIAYKYNDTLIAATDTVSISLCEHAGYDESGNPIPGDSIGTPITNKIEFDITTNSGTGTIGLSLLPDTYGVSSLEGKKLVKLSIGDFSQYTEIEILKSSVNLTYAGGYAVYLTSAGRNNNQPNKNEWISTGANKDGGKLVVDSTFSDNVEFLESGSGWKEDSDGNTALHLKKGRYLTLNYAPFSENPTVGTTSTPGTGVGKTISFELATRNCLKNDSVVVSCMDDTNGNERGFEITASSAILKSNLFGLQAKFRENTRIKIDFVIEGTRTEYTYTTIAGKDATEDDWETNKTSREALCIIYVDGVYQALKVIPDNTTFKQGDTKVAAKNIVFGSEDCDLDIYNIRIYDGALTPTQIVNNYAYDTPKYEDKIAIAARNDIFNATTLGNKPNINIAKLRKARPDLPFWYAKMEVVDGKEVTLPYDKTNWKVQLRTEFDNPMNTNDIHGGAISFTTDKGQLRNQGTSSMTYPWPWRNWDWKTKNFTYPNGSSSEKWCQYLGMSNAENISKITLKKDYASSEMCNNAITSEYFTDMALGISANCPNVVSPAMRAYGSSDVNLIKNTPYRLTFKAVPCFMFQEFNDANKQGSAGKGYEALGMMNLIPNKNEVGYLGFLGNYTWNPSNHTYAQSWELTDNMDDWFWYKKIEPVRVETYTDSDGNETTKIVNDCIECYEARYPKDSTVKWKDKDVEADFGSTPDGYINLTNDEKNAINDEQRDIIEFHNWLVDCNRQIPEDYKAEHGTYRDLTGDEAAFEWNINSDGTLIDTQDTPNYRLNKFINEAPLRLNVDQFCLYYIWRETFHAYDSGFKNLQIYTMGTGNGETPSAENPLQWGCMVRDADTTLGIQNTGKDIFPPHLEDIDYYEADKDAEGNAVNNVKFVYGAARNMYHAKTVDSEGGNPVLNGQFGSLWINLRDGFGSRITKIYQELSGSASAKWNATSAIKRFRDHQEKWCENLYNFGMRQYFGGDPFTKWIESGLGDKKNSRASWLERGFYYRDSKYKCLSDCCTFRGRTYQSPDPDVIGGETANLPLKMKTYIPMYFLCGATSEDASEAAVSIRITDTDNTFDVMPGEGGLGFPNTGDENTWFWGSTQLTEIGDLARVLKIKEIQKLNLPKVKELSLGHEAARDGKNGKPYMEYNGTEIREIQNDDLTSFSVDSMTQLTILDVTNHKVLNSINGLDKCTQLQELYMRGTDALQSIELPATTSIKKLYFGKAIRNIELKELTGITEFYLEDSKNIDSLIITKCSPYMAVESYNLVNRVISNFEKIYSGDPNAHLCELTGINWENCEVQCLERLLNINAKLEGKINLKGTLYNDLKVKLVNKYGNIDDPNNPLYVTYIQNAITSIKMPSKIYVFNEGETQLAFISYPANSNTYKSAEWTLESNDYATINSKTGVITRNNKVATSDTPAARLTVTVHQIPDTSTNTERDSIVSESMVYFYERTARPGDIVYADGSFSDEKDDTKNAIGICFYVDPKNPENRLMCALSPIGQYTWGAYSGTTYTSGQTETSYSYTGCDPKLNIFGEKYSFNLSEIADISNKGIDGTHDNYFTDELYRDSTNVDNGMFKEFLLGTDCIYGDLGWIKASKDIIVNGVTEIKANELVPSGYYKTLAIISNRNKLLKAYENTKGQTGAFINPETYASQEGISEYSAVVRLINAANSWSYEDRSFEVGGATGGALMYYPAASMCYAYEPSFKEINAKFKKHNWFLPSSGEMLRILYYIYQSYSSRTAQSTPVNSEISGANAFYTAIKDGVFNAETSYGKNYNTSTENTGNYNVVVYGSTGSSNFVTKGNSSSYNVMPICKF